MQRPAIVSSVKCEEEGKFEGKHKTGSSIIKQTQVVVVIVLSVAREELTTSTHRRKVDLRPRLQPEQWSVGETLHQTHFDDSLT